LVHLANRSALDSIVAAGSQQGRSAEESLKAAAAAAAIDAGESRDGDFEMFVLDMISEELQGRQRVYGSTLEQDERERQKRERRQRQKTVEDRRGLLSMDALLSLLVAEKRLLRDCGRKVADALMRAKLRKIGIT
jgi:hypothetical protein